MRVFLLLFFVCRKLGGRVEGMCCCCLEVVYYSELELCLFCWFVGLDLMFRRILWWKLIFFLKFVMGLMI